MTSGTRRAQPPYFAVILTSVRTNDDNGYADAARRMLELALEQPGFLGFESARQEIAESCRGAVLREFKQEPKKIIVSFSITP
jgi:hypothetical protein